MSTTPKQSTTRFASTTRTQLGRRESGQRRVAAPTSRTAALANYDDLGDLPDAAALASIGCGNPIAVADLHAGETVLDLGSGGGIDVLLSAKRVGPTGFAYGLDMTDEMLDLARRNAADAGATNVEFLDGHMEAIPLPDGVGRCRHLELRDQPVARQAGRVRRDAPRAPPRRPDRDQRRRHRGSPHRRRAARAWLLRRLHRRRPPGERVHRRACAPPGSSTCRSRSPTRSATASTARS